ncbi:hypothetical protein GCM10007984_30590 [Shewanella putrefaciens]|nr:hypothetical protein GCM10007984_30590 [Shewanella putrefaciens]
MLSRLSGEIINSAWVNAVNLFTGVTGLGAANIVWDTKLLIMQELSINLLFICIFINFLEGGDKE